MYGCSSSTKNASSSSSTTSECPDKPRNSLEAKSVKLISFKDSLAKESGQVNIGKQAGFSFEGKKGQKIKYASSEVCVWIYAPNNNLITDDTLPVDGRYVVQVAAIKGSTSFSLDLELRSADFIRSPVSSSQANFSPSPPASISSSQSDNGSATRPSPDAAILNHYKLIQNGQLDESWTNLSTSFQGANIAKGLSEYKEWWNSVETIQIGGVEILDRQSETAIARVDLSYRIRGGRVMRDNKRYIYLVWDNDRWLINDKSDTYRR
jgi:hypothetical protein